MHGLPLITFLLLASWAVGDDLVVNTPNGLIQGKYELTQFSNVTYQAFYSIRYAEPPIGNLRFQAPVPVKPWTTTYDATYEKNICFQVTTDSDAESEDCLFLNIFIPENPTNRDEKLPVMFFIHGGGFKEGYGMVKGGYGPEFFMEYDVVLITVNYRLGPFGFFSTGDGVIPGNAGLKDIQQALKWVQANIEYFGGDPDKVTVFGHSAGSATVSYQLLNPESAGLFRAVILQSGTSINPWAYQRDQVEITYRTAAYIDNTFDESEHWNSTALLEFLQQAEARDIDAASKSYSSTESTRTLQIQQGFYYGPIIENHANAPFLSKLPYESFKNGDYLQVPAMIGTVAEEGLYLLTDYFNWTLADYDNNPKLLVPGGLHISDEDDSETVGNLIKDEYTSGQSFYEDVLGGIKFHSEQDFTKSLIQDAKFQASRSSVYFYEFVYHGAMGDYPQELAGSGNVSHGEDQNYIFNRYMWYSKLNNANLTQFSEEDLAVHYRSLKLLVNFATYLNPTPGNDDLLQNVSWPQIKQDDFRYLEIGRNLEVKKDLKRDRMEFWERIYEDYGVEPFETF